MMKTRKDRCAYNMYCLERPVKVALIGLGYLKSEIDISEINTKIGWGQEEPPTIVIDFDPEEPIVDTYDTVFFKTDYGFAMTWFSSDYGIIAEPDEMKDTIGSLLYYLFGPHIIGLDLHDILTAWGEKMRLCRYLLNESSLVESCRTALDEIEIKYGFRNSVQVMFTGNLNISMLDIHDLATCIEEKIDEDAMIVFGAIVDPKLEGFIGMDVWV